MSIPHILENWSHMAYFFASAQHDQSSVVLSWWHKGLNMISVQLSEGTNPPRDWFLQHQVEVEAILLRKHAEFFKKDKVIKLTSNPEQAKASAVVVVGHDGVNECIDSSNARMIGNDSDVPKLFGRLPLPLEFAIAMIEILGFRALQSHLLAFLNNCECTLRESR